MEHAALVLEGGALRGVYTSGVLDVLMEEELWLPCVIGVSAGSLNGINYVSRQPGRSAKINLEYVRDRRYMSFGRFLRRKGVFGFDFLFGELSRKLVPLDFKTFYDSPTRYFAVATSCETGKPVLFEKGVCQNIMDAAEASSSMPVFCRRKKVEGKWYLDGGVSLSIPVQAALDLGYTRPVVIQTRNKGYRKQPVAPAIQRLYRRKFSGEPQLLEALLNAPERYNQETALTERLESEGKAFVFRPLRPVTVSRMEKDTDKLRALYEEGREEARQRLPELRAYLEEA